MQVRREKTQFDEDGHQRYYIKIIADKKLGRRVLYSDEKFRRIATAAQVTPPPTNNHELLTSHVLCSQVEHLNSGSSPSLSNPAPLPSPLPPAANEDEQLQDEAAAHDVRRKEGELKAPAPPAPAADKPPAEQPTDEEDAAAAAPAAAAAAAAAGRRQITATHNQYYADRTKAAAESVAAVAKVAAPAAAPAAAAA